MYAKFLDVFDFFVFEGNTCQPTNFYARVLKYNLFVVVATVMTGLFRNSQDILLSERQRYFITCWHIIKDN